MQQIPATEDDGDRGGQPGVGYDTRWNWAVVSNCIRTDDWHTEQDKL